MTQQLVVHSNVQEMRSLCVEGVNLASNQCSNKFLRSILTAQLYPYQLKRKYVLRDYNEVEVKKIRKQYLSYPIPHKAKEVTFKILNDIYSSNHFLHMRFNWDNNSCGFCERDIETVEHIFFECVHIVEFGHLFRAGC